MRLMNIASGSSGNCTYIGSDCTHLLVDAGLSGKRCEEGINMAGIQPSELDGILITHEHIDHIKGLGIMARRYQIPIYATEGTVRGIKRCSSIGEIDTDLLHVIRADEKFFLKDISVKPFKISHDANEPVGFRFSADGKSMGVATDLGTYTEYTIDNLRGLDVLLCESNHDVRMLEVGPYPYQLKERILSDRGHLSNENSGRLISQLLHDGMKEIVLGHLSKENNLPELAFESVRLEIEASDNKYHGNDFHIQVARPDSPLPVIEI